MITNGFTYIAFLIFLAGILFAAEKYTKWKIFNIIPPLVWIYLLNMLFCTIGMYDSQACSETYSALKNNLLYAMIFVMLLRCDVRKLAKLGGRMLAIFLAGAASITIGFIFAFLIFKEPLGGGETIWAAMAGLCASWIGGSANMAAIQAAFPMDPGAYGCALAVDTVYYSLWLALLLIMVRYAKKWDNAVKADTSTLQAIADAANQELDKGKKTATASDWIFLIGLSLFVSAISQKLGTVFSTGFTSVGLGVFDAGTVTILLVTILGLVCALSPLGKVPAVEELSNVYLYIVVSLMASTAALTDLISAPLWIVAGFVVLVIHVFIMFFLSKLFRWDCCMVSTASLANIGGSASGSIIASAYNVTYAGIGVMMGVIGVAVGNFFGLAAGYIMQIFL